MLRLPRRQPQERQVRHHRPGLRGVPQRAGPGRGRSQGPRHLRRRRAALGGAPQLTAAAALASRPALFSSRSLRTPASLEAGKGAFLGGTSLALERAGRMPMTLGRAGETTRSSRMLVATDFSEASARARDHAIALAAPGDEMVILHVHPLPLPDWPDPPYVPEWMPSGPSVRGAHVERLRALAERARGPRLRRHT